MGYRRVLVLIKQTAFEAYTAQQRIAAAAGHTLSYEAVRMNRLRERHDTHMMQVDRITEWLTARGVDMTSVMRDDATQDHVREADLVLALGGDGTTLIASHLIRDRAGPPLLGVNTDRASINDLATLYRSSEPVDMRRSTGHLCATTASGDMTKVLTEVLNGDVAPPSSRGSVASWRARSWRPRSTTCSSRIRPQGRCRGTASTWEARCPSTRTSTPRPREG